MDAQLHSRVRDRAGNRCEYCRLSQDHSPVVRFWIEHIIAKQHGGDDNPDNLALACPRCNRFKGPNLTGIDPKSGEIVPLFHPRKQRWQEHFTFDGVHVIGLTEFGRATIRLLRMNSSERLEIRNLLRQQGKPF